MDLENTEFAFGMAPERSLDIGVTTRSQEEFETYLEAVLSSKYNADGYEVFTRNCNHFARDCCDFLVGNQGEVIPQYVIDMSEQVFL
jgi:hypothetical protein